MRLSQRKQQQHQKHCFLKHSSCLSVLLLLLLLQLATDAVAARVRTKTKYMDVNDDPKVNVYNENTTPIVGVLTQEVSNFIVRKYPDNNFTSYIAASYVKFVEGAGGRVLPIWIGQTRDYYVDIMSKINGVLLPGGATFFNQSNGYADAGRYIYEIAVNMNERGVYMPIWGTCLGFELMVYLTANGTEPRTDCASSSQALPLVFKEGYKQSKLFGNASDELMHIWQQFPITANFHMYCFTEETFATMSLNQYWNALSVSYDWNDKEFISTIEHRSYPFYGVQFHPEKNLYEFIPDRNITHTSMAVQSSQYFANFFVNEARKNRNSFSNRSEETADLIYNYKPEYTGAIGSSFVQQYLFEERSAAPHQLHVNQCLTTTVALMVFTYFLMKKWC